jgi:hypothetical protein
MAADTAIKINVIKQEKEDGVKGDYVQSANSD